MVRFGAQPSSRLIFADDTWYERRSLLGVVSIRDLAQLRHLAHHDRPHDLAQLGDGVVLVRRVEGLARDHAPSGMSAARRTGR